MILKKKKKSIAELRELANEMQEFEKEFDDYDPRMCDQETEREYAGAYVVWAFASFGALVGIIFEAYSTNPIVLGIGVFLQYGIWISGIYVAIFSTIKKIREVNN